MGTNAPFGAYVKSQTNSDGSVSLVDASGSVIPPMDGTFDSTRIFTNNYLAIGSDTNSITVNGGVITGKHSVSVDGGPLTNSTEIINKADDVNATGGPVLYMARSRGTLAAPLIAGNGDSLASVVALGFDGVDYAESARIDFVVNALTGSNNMAGSISLKVSTSGSQTPAEALKIINNKDTYFYGNTIVFNAGNGLRVREGTNCKQGVANLAAGTVTVNNTAVTANSRIFLTSQVDGGTPGFLRVSARASGTSFTITSSSAADTSTVAYEIFEPS